MSAYNLRRLLTIQDLCQILNCKASYIHQRTGPRARRSPRIPSIPGMKPLKFDPLEIERLFFQPAQTGSLKISKVGNSTARSERRIERLW